MNKEIKAMWVNALRSGLYKQGTGALCKNGKHCCLGVLCQISNLKSKPVSQLETCTSLSFQYDYSESAWRLPHLFREKIGLSEKIHDKLMGMNDDGKSFKQIAAYIQRYA